MSNRWNNRHAGVKNIKQVHRAKVKQKLRMYQKKFNVAKEMLERIARHAFIVEVVHIGFLTRGNRQ